MTDTILKILDSMRERREKATPGPWLGILDYDHSKIYALNSNETLLEGKEDWHNDLSENLAFIAAARTEHAQLEEALRACLPALVYAYEDHNDQYYLNKIEQIEKILRGEK